MPKSKHRPNHRAKLAERRREMAERLAFGGAAYQEAKLRALEFIERSNAIIAANIEAGPKVTR